MSVLLVDPPTEVGRAIVTRLVHQGDEVRVVVERDDGSWRKLGAHVAVGDPADDDLVMRAGQHARTIVLFGNGPAELKAALDGAVSARIERGVLLVPPGTDISGASPDRLRSYVVLRTGRSRWGRRALQPQDIAVAVDAADDLAGEVRLDLDLTRASAWEVLGIVTR